MNKPQPVAKVERVGDHVEVTIGSSTGTFTPDQAEQFAVALLRKARPDQSMFIIPVDRS